MSYFQDPGSGPLTFLLRTTGNPTSFGSAIQRTVRELNPRFQVVGLKTMDDVVNESLAKERFVAQLASFFSLLALLLACVGLYGIMSYTVIRRTNEIGLRMALGARGWDVVWLVMKETMLLVAIGVTIGLIAALQPGLWIGLFSDDAEVARVGALYLRIVGPAYLFFGLGLGLFFVSQGFGRGVAAMNANAGRLVVSAAAGLAAVYALDLGVAGFCAAVAAGFCLYAALLVYAVLRVRLPESP